MATRSPGFLSKMAQMVRAAPAVTQEEGDSEQAREPDFAHSDLQARIDGKRRDDQVRRREFNHLRKVRASAGLGVKGMAAQNAFAMSSSFNPDDVTTEDRQHTLKKIDAIEAYMGEHLQRKQQAVRAASKAAGPSPSVPARQEVPVLTPHVGATASGTQGGFHAPAPESDSLQSEMDLDFTGMLSEQALQNSEPPAAVSSLSGYSESRLESHELGQGADHPALLDAAVRFAEGDVAGAEMALLAAMQEPGIEPELADRSACALMDLYRATDQGPAFDVVAIEYAQRFGRSAPEWYSIPHLLRNSGHMQQVQTPHGAAVWTCPPLLTAQGVAHLSAVQKGPLVNLQWSGLQTIAADALPALTQLLTRWAEQPVSLLCGGAEVFNAVLEAATVVGERQTDPGWWLLRMEALRVQGDHELFETVALDYCITYDVSPPSWMEAVCTCSNGLQDGDSATDDVLPAAPDRQAFVDTRAPPGPELRGELLGDAQAVLDQLHAGDHTLGEPLVIHCQRLLRVDFSAAGSMLNWLAVRRAEGVDVEFVQVPRLIGVFFQLMGIAEHARVVTTNK